ncbi:MAG: alcohol dehydrogenase catalytic domain-containing protein [Gemmatimonadetes bacterium]|nr:alcohol dehydrogenase catalytic domain-containing protein [Gemmatimonadota bacterium]NNM05421.1 alcohol dehydrogenase catalytic domain-containing protein [Gemmatimonadota bacterium]
MKAAVVEVFKEPLKIWNDWPDPEVGPDDVLVKVMANGICRSDWHLWQGHWDWMGFSPPLPAVLGHESAGVVEEVGSNIQRFKKGDRVVFPFGQACGHCETCAQGDQHVCGNLSMSMFRGAGGFGEYTIVTQGDVNLVTLPEGISFVEGASLGCRFMTAFHGITAQGKVEPGEWVAVFGCGGVGLAAVDIASAMGANVIAVSRGQEKLDKAIELGAVHAVQAGENTHEEIQEYTGGGVHVSAECLGTAATWMPSILSMRTGGRLVRMGMTGAEERGILPVPVDLMVGKELTIVGSMGMQARCYPEMLRMVESGKISPSSLVTQEVSLEGVNGVFEEMTNFNTLGYSVVKMG